MNSLYKKYLLVLTLFAGSVSLLYAQKNITFKSKLSYPGYVLSNIWGHAANGKEYALVGAENGLSIVDVTDPAAPVVKFLVPGAMSHWREIRTKGNYAYVVTEGGGGVTIVNLSYLPDSVKSKTYTGNGGIAGLSTIHALHVEGNRLYLYGTDKGGMLIVDITDPWNPSYLGKYVNYVHDGFATNDTVYAGEIYDGQMTILDTKNPASIQVINSQQTPGQFTHNTWMSTDRKTMYTTDEVSGSFVTSYDISDLQDIKELDRYQRNPGSGAIVHNTYVLNNPALTGSSNDFVVTSYYTEGVSILDATHPDNLVEVGHYDTYPGSGGSFAGAWGVYAYLPSGNLLISNINEGMFVLSPVYKQAALLEGVVRDSATAAPLSNALVELIGTSLKETTGISGVYKTGTVDSGYYSIKVSRGGYETRIIDNVLLDNGVITNLDILLPQLPNFTLTGTVVRSSDNAPVAFAKVDIRNSEMSYSATSDASGVFTVSPFYNGTYTVTAGKWSYKTSVTESLPMDSTIVPLTIALDPGYYDDFLMDFGWTVSGTAPRGVWERGEPLGTMVNNNPANPENDVTTDYGDQCYVTGNAGGAAGVDDVDDGTAILTSPVFDLSAYANPYVHYYRWFVNAGGGSSLNDTLFVRLNNGSSTKVIEKVNAGMPGNGTWILKSYRVADYITPGSSMKIIFETGDLAASGNVVEAGVDKFIVTEGPNSIAVLHTDAATIHVYPNPAGNNGRISYELKEKGNASLQLTDMLGRELMQVKLTEQAGTVPVPANLPEGMYMVHISTGSASSVLKFIK